MAASPKAIPKVQCDDVLTRHGRYPNRRVVNGRADVSAEELADFKRKYGADKTLRDLLNMDKGLTRRGGQSMREKFANQYEDPIKAFASAELGMGEGPGRFRSKRSPSKAPVTPTRAGVSRDMPSAPSGGGMDEDRRAGVAEIPGAGPYKAPSKSGRSMSETERNVRNTLNAIAPLAPLAMGAGVGRMAAGSRMARDVGVARAMGKDAASMPRSVATPAKDAARTTSETGQRFTPKEQVQAAESTARGSVNRRQIQEAREGREKLREEAKSKFMQKEKQSKPFKPGQREDADVEFRRGGKTKAYAKGGSVKGAGAAQRGVRPCKYI